jgi:hypothetical protein
LKKGRVEVGVGKAGPAIFGKAIEGNLGFYPEWITGIDAC